MNDLLDCDCGYVTDYLKIYILMMLEGHILHDMERGLDHE